jgi:hypothetical protein
MAIQGWLGHRSITSTAVYTALAPNRFKDFYGLSHAGVGRRRGVLDDNAIGAAAIEQPPAIFAVIVCRVDKAATNPIFHGAARFNLIAEARR